MRRCWLSERGEGCCFFRSCEACGVELVADTTARVSPISRFRLDKFTEDPWNERFLLLKGVGALDWGRFPSRFPIRARARRELRLYRFPPRK